MAVEEGVVGVLVDEAGEVGTVAVAVARVAGVDGEEEMVAIGVAAAIATKISSNRGERSLKRNACLHRLHANPW